MVAADKRDEKGIPLILEGVNLNIEMLVSYLKNTPPDAENKNKILCVTLYMDDEEEHCRRLAERCKMRKLSDEDTDKYIKTHFKNIRKINDEYKKEHENFVKINSDPRLFLLHIDNNIEHTAKQTATLIFDYMKDKNIK